MLKCTVRSADVSVGIKKHLRSQYKKFCIWIFTLFICNQWILLLLIFPNTIFLKTKSHLHHAQFININSRCLVYLPHCTHSHPSHQWNQSFVCILDSQKLPPFSGYLLQCSLFKCWLCQGFGRFNCLWIKGSRNQHLECWWCQERNQQTLL